jgi:hypothetical protein
VFLVLKGQGVLQALQVLSGRKESSELKAQEEQQVPQAQQDLMG